jgi:Animal haem peroxidase
VDLLRAYRPPLAPEDTFAEARRLASWHYQWMILHEVLPLFIGPAAMIDLLTHGRRFYLPRTDRAFIPVEFQIAYRFGHSMVRPSYRANLTGDNGRPFFGMIFDPAGEGSSDPVDLRGGVRAPRRFVGWQTFFDFGDGEVKPNKRIDTKISSPLFNLPLGAIPSGSPPTSLAQRNLLRHLTWELPSGQAIAAAIGAPVLSAADLAELRPLLPSFADHTPLWYYILKEAELLHDGLHLGPVGGGSSARSSSGCSRATPTAT